MAVVDAVTRDLETFGDLKDSALAAAALALAGEIDDAENSATSKSMCARELRDTMAALRALAPPKEMRDGIDDIAAQRIKRRRDAGSAAAADLSRP